MRLVAALFEHFEIGQHEFGQNRLQIPDRIDRAFHMDHVRILKEPDHMRNRVHPADVPEKLVAQPLPLTRSLDQTGNIDEFQRGGHNPPGVLQIGEHLKPLIRNRDDAGIRLDRAEREIRRFRSAPAERVEQR